jgi:hypothetical protein
MVLEGQQEGPIIDRTKYRNVDFYMEIDIDLDRTIKTFGYICQCRDKRLF